MRHPFFRLLFILLVASLLVSWGSRGHRTISENISLSFNSEMAPFLTWMPFVADHSSDADYRKDEDPNEAVRHYIDIDYYPEFLSNGKIAQAWDSIVAQHGIWIVTNTGILPWATLSTYNSLVIAMEQKDWYQAMVLTADLSHYVGDGHMPLHLTENYNGQMTGNSGIHSRYETTMINAHVNEIIYSGDSIRKVEDVQGYIFKYIYTNYPYIDSILAADTYARSLNSSTSSSEYKQALWDKTKGFTIKLFSDASHALAELIYTAWVEAGKPEISTGTGDAIAADAFTVSPNPFNDKLNISFSGSGSTEALVTLTSISGETVLTREWKPENSAATGYLTINTSTLPTGVYLLRLMINNRSTTLKVVKTK